MGRQFDGWRGPHVKTPASNSPSSVKKCRLTPIRHIPQRRPGQLFRRIVVHFVAARVPRRRAALRPRLLVWGENGHWSCGGGSFREKADGQCHKFTILKLTPLSLPSPDPYPPSLTVPYLSFACFSILLTNSSVTYGCLSLRASCTHGNASFGLWQPIP